MEKTAIILANDNPAGFEQDKGLTLLNKKPLIQFVLDKVEDFVDEVVIVANSEEQVKAYKKIMAEDIRFVVDEAKIKTELTGALTGFKASQGIYSLLIPYDAPFLSSEIVSLLLDCGQGKTATIPRWTNGEEEPLLAVYHTDICREVAQKAVDAGESDIYSLVGKLRGVRYISSLVFEQLDPEMRSFFRVITPVDLKRAVVMLTPKAVKYAKGKRKK